MRWFQRRRRFSQQSRHSSVKSKKSTTSNCNLENIDVEDEEYNSKGFVYWFNLLLCRGDLNKESYETKPVGFMELVSVKTSVLKIF